MLRGVRLVEKVIAHLEKTGGGEDSVDPEPMSPANIDALEKKTGVALSPSLRAWLAYDAGALQSLKGSKTLVEPMTKIVARHAGELARMYRPFVAARFDGPAIQLDSGSDSLRALWLADPDQNGEYPVLEIDHDDGCLFGVFASGFDLWLACRNELPGYGLASIRAERGRVALRVLGRKEGYLYLEGKSLPELTRRLPAPPPPRRARLAAAPARAPKPIPDGKLMHAMILAYDRKNFERLLVLATQWCERGLPRERLVVHLAFLCSEKVTAMVDAYLALGVPYDHKKTAPLVYAASNVEKTNEKDALAIMERLLALGASPNGTYFGQPAIVAAATSGTPKTVARLLRAGANPNVRHAYDSAPRNNFTALEHVASGRDAPEMLRVLLAGGAKVGNAVAIAKEKKRKANHAFLAAYQPTA